MVKDWAVGHRRALGTVLGIVVVVAGATTWFAVRGGAHLVPDRADDALFLDTFWQQVVATTIGVFIGVRLESRQRARAQRQQDEVAKRDLEMAVTLARQMAERNRDLLVLADAKVASADPLGPVFDTDSWSLIGPELFELPTMRRDLNAWHVELRYIRALYRAMQDLQLGGATQESKVASGPIWDLLREHIDRARPRSVTLIARLEAIETFLRAGLPEPTEPGDADDLRRRGRRHRGDER